MERQNFRSEKSLSTLTKKFVEILKTQPTVDLNDATNALQNSKKRRIYDITNVMEGVGLIRKVSKNTYQWVGKTYISEEGVEHELLKNKRDQERLRRKELELDNDLRKMQMSVNALFSQKSYCYLNQSDFLHAYNNTNQTVLIAKDIKEIKFIQTENDNRFDSMLLTGKVECPIKLMMVNNYEKKRKSELKFDEITIDLTDNDNMHEIDPIKSNLIPKQPPKVTDNIVLFRRRQYTKPLQEHDQKDLEEIASNVLSRENRDKEKSKFSFVSEHQLVTEEDYTTPSFLEINQPVDTSYEDNYSYLPPSVHDLFDFDVYPELEEETECEEMDIDEGDERYIEDDNDIIEEYIVEDNDYEILGE